MLILLTAITLGFLGSFHCVGMCGPIALALPLNRKNILTITSGVLTYNGGRILTYALFGCLFGLVGSSFVIAGYQRILSIALGIGLIISVLLPENAARRFRLSRNIFSIISAQKANVAKLFRRTGYPSLLLIGMLNGLLPCGFVYTAVAGSILTGGVLQGALFMAFFGLGTLPAMAALSLAGNKIGLGFRNRLRQAVPVFIIAMAALLILRGLNLGIPYLSPKLSSSDWTQHTCCHKMQSPSK